MIDPRNLFYPGDVVRVISDYFPERPVGIVLEYRHEGSNLPDRRGPDVLVAVPAEHAALVLAPYELRFEGVFDYGMDHRLTDD